LLLAAVEIGQNKRGIEQVERPVCSMKIQGYCLRQKAE
jgi:hypothetical protein